MFYFKLKSLIGFFVFKNINFFIQDEGLTILCFGLIHAYRSQLRNLRLQTMANGSDDQKDSLKSSDDLLSLNLQNEILNKSSNYDSLNNMEVEEESLSPNSFPWMLQNLQHLILVDNRLTHIGMQDLALLLMQAPKNLVFFIGGLSVLNLSYNYGIGNAGVEVLCEGLIRNHSLKELYLKAIQMSFPGT